VVHAGTVGEALELLKAASRRPRRPRAGRTIARQGRAAHRVDVSGLPDEPGVYLFRNAQGQVLYVGKSVAVRTRARSHFQPSSASEGWVAQATMVDHRTTASELGALVLEQRLIKELRPPGNVRMKHDDPYVYLRCRLDIAYPVLEVAPVPASGRAVTVGPLRGRRAAIELMEQLNSLFTLRHCGRALRLREHPSAYGQMGRCLSPCLNDLDPNLYRSRLDAALGLFTGGGDGGAALLAHVEREMRRAADEQRFERAAWLRRRLRRLRELTESLAGVLEATHARPRLVLAPHPRGGRADAFWLVGGRLVNWGPAPPAGGGEALAEQAAVALRAGDGRGSTAWLAPDEVEELRVVTTYLASHELPGLDLHGALGPSELGEFADSVTAAVAV
jgi:DNA polymerase-3 subunit epsilon